MIQPCNTYNDTFIITLHIYTSNEAIKEKRKGSPIFRNKHSIYYNYSPVESLRGKWFFSHFPQTKCAIFCNTPQQQPSGNGVNSVCTQKTLKFCKTAARLLVSLLKRRFPLQTPVPSHLICIMCNILPVCSKQNVNGVVFCFFTQCCLSCKTN